MLSCAILIWHFEDPVYIARLIKYFVYRLYSPRDYLRFQNSRYCCSSELLLRVRSQLTLCCSYGRTVSCASRLNLIYYFLSQGKGGRRPVSCPTVQTLRTGTGFLITKTCIKWSVLFLTEECETSVLWRITNIRCLSNIVILLVVHVVMLCDRPIHGQLYPGIV